MKTTKRILGILLALALVFTLALPALAADPIITGVIPQNPIARTGKSITLTVEAELPEGDAGPLSYQWYQWVDGDWEEIAGATAKSLTVTATAEEFIPDFSELDSLDSLNFDVRGIAKQYQVVVSCAEGETELDFDVVFILGFFDMYSTFFQISLATALYMLDLDSSALPSWADAWFGIPKVLVAPILLPLIIILWYNNFTKYGII